MAGGTAVAIAMAIGVSSSMRSSRSALTLADGRVDSDMAFTLRRQFNGVVLSFLHAERLTTKFHEFSRFLPYHNLGVEPYGWLECQYPPYCPCCKATKLPHRPNSRYPRV